MAACRATLVHPNTAVGAHDGVDGGVDTTIHARPVHVPQKEALNERRGYRQVLGLAAHVIQRTAQVPGDVPHGECESRDLVLRHRNHRRGPEGTESHAQHRDRPGRPQRQLPGELARKQDHRLALRGAVSAHALEGVAEVQHQLRLTVRQYGLRCVIHFSCIAGQRPDPADERRQLRPRRVLAIFHGFRHATPAGRICPSGTGIARARVTRMRTLSFAGLLSIVAAAAATATAQDRPNLSGVWTLPADAPAGPTGKPASAPGFGPQITIWHDGNSFTVTRVFSGGTVATTHVLDGSETRSRTPGRLCEGDSQSVWSAAWQDNSVLTTLVGSIPPGASATTKMDVKAAFRPKAADTMVVELTFRNAGMTEPRTITTIYKKNGPPPGPPPTVSAPALAAKISQVEWLGGTWIGTTGTSAFEERWTPPGGGSMLAVARSLRNGIMNSFEFLCIVERNGGLVYTAMPNGRQPATDFALTKIEPDSLTFENPAHDFPKMIRYTLGQDGTLEAVVSGTDKQKPQVFRFKKQ